ncbi:hypothetical protein RN001_002605 [Aquatica leii]|uniref:DUF4806 domain-containing protein n=1 Tax=Aquatica leii TaxID=1421715 RepID=A0AAN7SLW9_9COLE|nr:hypothetical protein RN001_002605 [Aquatica leii]
MTNTWILEQFKPDSRSWSLESVKFLGYYGSYEKARNIAAESDYTSITEILGRGCRISKPTDAERQYNKRFASPVVNGFITDEDEEEEKNKKIDNCTKLVCRIGENGADFMKNVFTLIYDDKFAAENTWMGKKNKLNLSELKFNKTVREVIQSKFPDLTSSDFTRIYKFQVYQNLISLLHGYSNFYRNSKRIIPTRILTLQAY